jgi:hypothetical protein
MRLLFEKGHPYVDATVATAAGIKDGSGAVSQKLIELTKLSADLADHMRRLDRMRDGAEACNDRRMVIALERQREKFSMGLRQIAKMAASMTNVPAQSFGYAPRHKAYPKWDRPTRTQ